MARILVLEKDAAVRRLIALQLARLGHEPVAGLAELGIDLAVVEPNGHGAYGVADALAREDVPFVFVSTEEPSRATLALAPKAHLLKPFTRAELQQAVAWALAQPAPEPAGSAASSDALETGFATNALGASATASSRG